MGLLPDAFEMEWFLWYNSAALIMMILTIIHFYKVALDLWTSNRKCLDHRTTKPKLTKEYKFVQYLTLTILISYLLSAVFFGLEMASYTWSLQVCININNAGGWFLLFGKGCMYMLFMYRLHMCYGKSAYGYSKRFLYTIGWCNVAFGLIAEAVTTYMTAKYWVFFADNDGFPNPCFPIVTPGDWTVQYFPMTMMSWDFSMNVLSLFLFINPLRKALKAVRLTHDKDSSSSNLMTRSMIYIAIKYTILTSVASLTTSFFWICVNWILPTAYYVVSFDVVINSICIMLMTAYYQDQRYYERLCCCCVFLCVPKKVKQMKTQKKSSNVSKERVRTVTNSTQNPSQTPFEITVENAKTQTISEITVEMQDESQIDSQITRAISVNSQSAVR